MTNAIEFARGDMLKGEVTRLTRNGVYIAVNGINGEGFCKCSLNQGTIALFEIVTFTITADGVKLKLALGSVIEYGEAA